MTGLPFGIGVTVFYMWFLLSNWDSVSSVGIEQGISASSVFGLDLLLFLPFALVICGFMGAIAGLFFAKFFNGIRVPSIHVRTVLFGFVLWLSFSLLSTYFWIPFSLLYPIPLWWYPGSLIIFLCESFLFAYLFSRWMKSPMRKPIVKLTWLDSVLTPRRMALLCCAAIFGGILYIVWRIWFSLTNIELVPNTRLLFVFILGAILLFLIWALTQAVGFLRRGKFEK